MVTVNTKQNTKTDICADYIGKNSAGIILVYTDFSLFYKYAMDD